MTSLSIFAIGQTSLRGSLTPKDLNTSDTFCDEPLIEILSPLEIEDRLKEELVDIAQIDQEPSLEGRQLLMVLSPLKKKS